MSNKREEFSFRRFWTNIIEKGLTRIAGYFVLLIIIGAIVTPLIWDCFRISDKCDDSKIIDYYQFGWTIILSIVAVILFLKRKRDDSVNYLELKVLVERNEKYNIIRTELFNPTEFDRDIYCAFLIITKTGTNILEQINEFLLSDFKDTNSLYRLKDRKVELQNGFAFIPLSYYTEENIRIGNERLIFEIPLKNISKENEAELVCYDARFFVYRSPKDINSYHRSVSCSFASQMALSENQHLIYQKENKIFNPQKTKQL